MTSRLLSGYNIIRRGHSARAVNRETEQMKYEYTLVDGAHFSMTSWDLNDLLDVINGREKASGDAVPVHRLRDIVSQLERGLEQLERDIVLDIENIRERRAVRELDEWEPADD